MATRDHAHAVVGASRTVVALALAATVAGCGEQIPGARVERLCGYGYVWVDAAGRHWIGYDNNALNYMTPVARGADLDAVCGKLK